MKIFTRKTLQVLLVFISFNQYVNAQQTGSIDLTFGKPVLSVGDSTRFGSLGKVNAIIELQGGKLLVAGDFDEYNGVSHNNIARLDAKENYDASFQVSTGFNNVVNDIALSPAGDKIYAVGDFTTIDAQPSAKIARLDSAGVYDPTFDVGTGFTSFGAPTTMAIQPDGKILVGGDFTQYDGTTINRLIRLNSDGTIDNTFNIGTGFSNAVKQIKLLSNGKILVAGSFISYNGTSSKYIARLNADGSLDNTFSIGTGFNNQVLKFLVQPDDKIIVGGYFTTYNANPAPGIIRLDDTGAIDATFNVGTGFTPNYGASAFCYQNGKIIINGASPYNGNTVGNIFRVNADGSLDNTFRLIEGGSANIILIENDGRILIGSSSGIGNTIRHGIARLDSDGYLNSDFSVETGFFDRKVYEIVIQPDNKILVGGEFLRYDGFICAGLIRLLNDGSIDTTFHPDFTSSTMKPVNSIVIDTINYKIYIGGKFTEYGGQERNKIARLNWDGSLDNTFNIGDGFGSGGEVFSMALQSDGKIVVGGNFSSYDGTTCHNITRLKTNGSLDLAFNNNLGTGVNFIQNDVNAVVIQADKKILIGGDIWQYNGSNVNNLVRIDSTGTFDPTFTASSSISEIINTICLLPNNEILVGGYDGLIQKLNNDGTTSTSFTVPQFPNQIYYSVNSLRYSSSLNKVYVAFENTISNNSLRLISTDGINDNSFVVDEVDNLKEIAIQDDGKVLIGGSVYQCEGYFINGMARIISSTGPTALETTEAGSFSVYPNPASNEITINNIPLSENHIRIMNSLGQEMKSFTVNNKYSYSIDISDLVAGIYIVKIDNNINSPGRVFVKK